MDGVEVTPSISFNITDVDGGLKHFKNNSGQNDSFTIKVLLNRNEVFDGFIKGTETVGKELKVIDALDYYIRKAEPFYINTRAIGINKNDLYLVTENNSRQQLYDDNIVIWELTFTKYVSLPQITFKNTNTAIKQAIKTYNKEKAKKKASAKKKTTTRQKFKTKCKPSKLKYSKNKKIVTCVKYMQLLLWKKGFLKKSQVDGWFGKVTVNAVKKFQKKYKKKYKLKVNGKVDNNTFKALYSA